jgi:hypothetical protein
MFLSRIAPALDELANLDLVGGLAVVSRHGLRSMLSVRATDLCRLPALSSYLRHARAASHTSPYQTLASLFPSEGQLLSAVTAQWLAKDAMPMFGER